MKYEYSKVIQQNYGNGYEDVSMYKTNSTNTIKDKSELNCYRNDLKEYKLMGYPTRVINRKTKLKQMESFLYMNDKEFQFFEASDSSEARHKVINSFDLSFNPYIFKVLELSDDKFTVCAKGIDFLRLKKHFKFAYGGDNTATFRK